MADNPTDQQALDEAIDLIEQNGYTGFGTDGRNYYCVRHAIEVIFDDNFQPVVDFATQKGEDTKPLTDPKGQLVYPWFTTVAIARQEGVFCSVFNCPVAIAEEAEETEAEALAKWTEKAGIPKEWADENGGYDEDEAAELEDYLGPH